jgi:hypothetical protein
MQFFMISPGLLVWGLLSLFAIAGLWVAPIALSTWLAGRRGRHSLFGFALGLLLGWIGFVVLLLLARPSRSRQEPVA